jgi:septin 4
MAVTVPILKTDSTMCLRIVAGFGDAVNCEDTWKACSAYIDEQFRQYFTDESGLNRKNIQDNRVHCCLYFTSSILTPILTARSPRSLRQIDLEVLRRLHRKVNVVPVIAKADTLTTHEVKKLKERILADIEEHEIQVRHTPESFRDLELSSSAWRPHCEQLFPTYFQTLLVLISFLPSGQIYQFPDCDSDEDEEFKQQDKELKACIPFAVVGSSTVLEVAGRKVRGRQYPWGVVEGDGFTLYMKLMLPYLAISLVRACEVDESRSESELFGPV